MNKNYFLPVYKQNNKTNNFITFLKFKILNFIQILFFFT